MPKKIDPDALLRSLRKADADELRPVSTRVSVKCLRRLMALCVKEKLDLAVVLRQVLEANPGAGPGGSAEPPLPEGAQPWLDRAVQLVRRAYLEGISPIDLILQEPLTRGFGRTTAYKGPLAPLIRAAIESVPVQEILDHRTLEVIEEQKARKNESYAQRSWRNAIERAPAHVRPHAAKLTQLELAFRARVRLGWRPQDEDAGEPPVIWWFDDSVTVELQQSEPADGAIRSLQLLLKGGFLIPEENRSNSYRWADEWM